MAAPALRRLVKSVSGIIDRPMHQLAVRRFIDERPADEVVEGLRDLMTAVDRHGYRETYRAVVRFVVSDRALAYARVEELYRAAVAADCEPVRHLLLRAPAHRQAREDEVHPDPDTRELPLGVRKSMARSPDRDVLTRLVLDPAIPVIEILLENPKVVEQDVVRIAARRPNLPGVLVFVGDHPKWSLRYPVVQALVQNPYTPTPLSAAFTPFLKSPHLVEVAGDLGLHEVVRRCAAALIAWRRERRGGEAAVAEAVEPG